MANLTYKVVVQLKDVFKGINLNDSGGCVFVCNAGTPTLASITDLNGNALANPIQLTSGLIAFAYSSAASAEQTGIDLYGITAKGYWFEYVGITPGLPNNIGGPSGPNEINIDTSIKRMRMKIPFAVGNSGPAGNCVAGTEFKTGLKLPVPAMVLDRLHGAGVLVTTAQSSQTISVGILSSETGGSASGFINGSTLAPTSPSQLVIGTNGSFFSSNAPYTTDSQSSGTANGTDISLTLSSGTTTAQGFVLLPYVL
jgi:hypothetical protein